MKLMDKPSILRGTFDWKRNGYRLATPLPASEPHSRIEKEPWIAVAEILERAKRGDFTRLRELKNIIDENHEEPELIRACIDLLGDAAPDDDLDIVASLMLEAPFYLRMEACHGAQWAGSLWLIPFMVEVWAGLDRSADRDTVAAIISNCLDPLWPPDDQLEFFGGDWTVGEYRRKVEDRVKRLSDTFGTDRAAIFAGQLFSVRKIALDMQHLLAQRYSDEWVDWGDFLQLRHRFEASTGIDCSLFYIDQFFNPEGAHETVEQFVRSDALEKFLPGQRYFFAHQVPDAA